MKNNFLTFTLFIITISILGFSSTVNSHETKGNGLATLKADHLLIGVVNFEETIEWYREVLGFEEEVRWKVEGLPNLDLAYLNNGEFRIEIIADKTGEQNNKQVDDFGEHLSHQGFTHICFEVEDIDLAMQQLNEKGIETFVRPATYPLNFYKRRVGFIKDLNGNVIEFAGPIEDLRKQGEK